MRSLLDALQAGRLIELTDNHKTKALEYLAALIEAIPGHRRRRRYHGKRACA